MARKPSRSREVAEKISAHLHRFERDPKINVRRRLDPETRKWVETDPKDPRGLARFYIAQAWPTGNGRVSVIYVSYQGSSALPIAEAEAYLAWLDAGHVGTHHEQQHEQKRAAKAAARDDLQCMVDAACPPVLPGTCKLGCGRPIWVESRTVGGEELRMCELHTRNVWSGAIDEDGIVKGGYG